ARSSWRGAHPLGHDRLDNLGGQLRPLGERLLSGFLALADKFAVELKPGPLLVDYGGFNSDVEDAAFFVDAMVINNVELGLGEGGGDLVFDDFHFHMVADRRTGRV